MEPELVVLSHLRWTFVWQRPQHIISRLARDRRTWFVEEPLAGDVDAPTLRTEQHGAVTRVWLEVPSPGRHGAFGDGPGRHGAFGDGPGRHVAFGDGPGRHVAFGDGPGRHVGFDHRCAASYAQAVQQLLGMSNDRTVWLYTPMALEMANVLRPSNLVYDVMDDLASFKGAPAELRLRHRQALRQADVVFAGGRSLYKGVVGHRPQGTHLFASGVEPEHFAPASALRPAHRPTPVAGYVGVIDERVDLDLLAELAGALPDWQICVVGPVAKIDPASLPQAPNLVYPGPQPYQRLPEVMAGFDVALMPFALNEATRSISPTKTLEYFAAGLPVVSTRVPDVVADHGAHVHLADDGPAFAAACHRARRRPAAARAEIDAVVRGNTWDSIATRMTEVLDGTDSAVQEMA